MSARDRAAGRAEELADRGVLGAACAGAGPVRRRGGRAARRGVSARSWRWARTRRCARWGRSAPARVRMWRGSRCCAGTGRRTEPRLGGRRAGAGCGCAAWPWTGRRWFAGRRAGRPADVRVPASAVLAERGRAAVVTRSTGPGRRRASAAGGGRGVAGRRAGADRAAVAGCPSLAGRSRGHGPRGAARRRRWSNWRWPPADQAGCAMVEELILHTPLVIPATGAVTLRVTITRAGLRAGSAPPTSSPAPSDDATWTRNATAALTPSTPRRRIRPGGMAPARSRPCRLAGFYDRLARERPVRPGVPRPESGLARAAAKCSPKSCCPKECPPAATGCIPPCSTRRCTPSA